MTVEERVAALEALVGVQAREIANLRDVKDGMMKKGMMVLGAGLTGAGLYIWGNHFG